MLDFADSESARSTINDWTKQRTGGRITDALPPGAVDAQTRLVLSNAAYFASPWKLTFDVAMTSDQKFLVKPDMSAPVPMMRQTYQFTCFSFNNMKVLRMRFEGKSPLSMYFVLPQQYGKLAEVESFAVSVWDEAFGHASMHSPKKVRVGIPRFSFSHTMALKDVLASIGMRLPFDIEKADFSRIRDPKDQELFLTDVHHRAFVKIDEKGAEAAAVTLPVAGAKDKGPGSLSEFIADEPFLFFIRHDPTGLILFMGRVSDPR